MEKMWSWPQWKSRAIHIWTEAVHIQRLLFFMDMARFMTVFIWIGVLGSGWFEADKYLKAVEVMAQSGVWPSEKLSVLDSELQHLNAEMRNEQERSRILADVLASIDKRLTLVDERQQAVMKRLDKSEAFWQSLQEKFLWAVVGQIGVLFVWFLLGHDLKRRMKLDHDSFYGRLKERYPHIVSDQQNSEAVKEVD